MYAGESEAERSLGLGKWAIAVVRVGVVSSPKTVTIAPWMGRLCLPRLSSRTTAQDGHRTDHRHDEEARESPLDRSNAPRREAVKP